MPPPLKIGILGSRGIPNRYGGFEECAEQLALRLVANGHEVSVYTVGYHPYKQQSWNGIKRILINDPETTFGAAGHFIYDLRCNLDSRKRGFDILLHLGYTSDSVWYWLWSKKTVHLVNMDGQEWKRSKYSAPVRAFLKAAERMATLRSKWLIADSPAIKEYLVNHYQIPVEYIAYGAIIPGFCDRQVPGELGLEPGMYDIIIARFIKDNNIEMAIRAKQKANDNIPLVIMGNENAYRDELERKYRDVPNIKFLPPQYEKRIVDSLRHFCRLYIHGHSSGGTNPSLLESMACGAVIAAHDNPFNRAVTGQDAYYYSTSGELTKVFKGFDQMDVAGWKDANLIKIKSQYNWDLVAEQYEKLMYEAIGNK
jgi:glycosyltransferase involved in cell wall biosynthesis